jgi:GNAT superfamily N-acetyltransferase
MGLRLSAHDTVTATTIDTVKFSEHLRTDIEVVPREPVAGLLISELSVDDMEPIFRLNETIFGEERVINTFDRPDLLLLLASLDGQPVGFKVGYRENRFVFYSAKGGVLPDIRRKGIAVALMDEMMERAGGMGYSRFAFDTFPNLHPGMTVLGIREGFRLMKADYNTTYREYRLRFEKRIEKN